MEAGVAKHGPLEPAESRFHRGTNQSGMRDYNERLVLTLVRQHGSLAKTEIAQNLIGNVKRGFPLDPNGIHTIIDVLTTRKSFEPSVNLEFGYFILTKTDKPEEAYEFLEKATRDSTADSPPILQLIDDLRTTGREQWADKLEELTRAKSHHPATGE